MVVLFTEIFFFLNCYMYFFGCLKQPPASTGPAQRVVEQPAAAGTAKAMEQNQPDPLPQPHPLPQPQPTAPVATRVALQLSMVRITINLLFLKALKYQFSSKFEEVQKVRTTKKEKARKLWEAGWDLLIVTPLVQWGQLSSADWSVWISQIWFKSHGQGSKKNVTCVLSLFLFHLWALLLDCPLPL